MVLAWDYTPPTTMGHVVDDTFPLHDTSFEYRKSCIVLTKHDAQQLYRQYLR